jgi:hypothetical protein
MMGHTRSAPQARARAPFVMICACAVLLGGCATRYEAMVPANVVASKKHAQAVSVEVTGGDKAGGAIGAPIPNEVFAQALEQAITDSKIFARVDKGGNANYRLSVTIFSLNQPVIGFALTVKMEAGWTLKRADTGAIVWQESIQTEHTAGMGEGLAFSSRLRSATESAARTNISEGLSKISQLNL